MPCRWNFKDPTCRDRWIIRAIVAGIAAVLLTVCRPTTALGSEASRGDAYVHGWPTFAPTDDPDRVVISPSVPLAPRVGAAAPATAPLPPGVLTGGLLLVAQWIVLRFHKTRRI